MKDWLGESVPWWLSSHGIPCTSSIWVGFNIWQAMFGTTCGINKKFFGLSWAKEKSFHFCCQYLCFLYEMLFGGAHLTSASKSKVERDHGSTCFWTFSVAAIFLWRSKLRLMARASAVQLHSKQLFQSATSGPCFHGQIIQLDIPFHIYLFLFWRAESTTSFVWIHGSKTCRRMLQGTFGFQKTVRKKTIFFTKCPNLKKAFSDRKFISGYVRRNSWNIHLLRIHFLEYFRTVDFWYKYYYRG